MQHLTALQKKQDLIDKYGIGNAHLIWSMGLILDESDFEKLAIDGLTDGGNDKKIDFIYVNNTTLIISQGYYSLASNPKVVAPANKASDLNTALAWIISGQGMSPNPKLRKKIEEVRALIKAKEIESIELLYIHNCSESENVRLELETCTSYLTTSLHDEDIEVTYKELGITSLEKLYIALSQQIIITQDVKFEGDIIRSVTGDGWVSHVGFAKGSWLNQIFKQHGDDLFSANYRGFMGLNKRKKNKLSH